MSHAVCKTCKFKWRSYTIFSPTLRMAGWQANNDDATAAPDKTEWQQEKFAGFQSVLPKHCTAHTLSTGFWIPVLIIPRQTRRRDWYDDITRNQCWRATATRQVNGHSERGKSSALAPRNLKYWLEPQRRNEPHAYNAFRWMIYLLDFCFDSEPNGARPKDYDTTTTHFFFAALWLYGRIECLL